MDSTYPLKVIQIVCNHYQTMLERSGRNKDISVADQFASLMQVGLNAGGAGDNSISKRKDVAGIAKLVEGGQLHGGVLCEQPAQDFVTSNYRKRQPAIMKQIDVRAGAAGC